MSIPYLPDTALWEVIKGLSVGEYRRIRGILKNSRLEWLLAYLRKSDYYSRDDLVRKVRNKYGYVSDAVISSYKGQLWNIIGAELIQMNSYINEKEIYLMKKLWLSIVLYHKGMTLLSRRLWIQYMRSCIEAQMYEFYLWGALIFEVYQRDLGDKETLTLLTQETKRVLIRLINRHRTLVRKFVFSANRYGIPKGRGSPRMTIHDSWRFYVKRTLLIQKHLYSFDQRQYLFWACHSIKGLLQRAKYQNFHYVQVINNHLVNFGVVLLNLGQWEYVIKWRQVLLEKSDILFKDTYSDKLRIPLIDSILIFAKCHQAKWEEALNLYKCHKAAINYILLNSTLNPNFRISLAAVIYLVMAICEKDDKEKVRYRLAVERWIEEDTFTGESYFWWLFIRWYEAYRLKDTSWMKYWSGRISRAYRKYFSSIKSWFSVIRLLRSVSFGIQRTQRRRVQQVLDEWGSLPSQRTAYNQRLGYLPMRLILLSILHRRPIEVIQEPVYQAALPVPYIQEIEDTLKQIGDIKL